MKGKFIRIGHLIQFYIIIISCWVHIIVENWVYVIINSFVRWFRHKPA